MNQLKKMLQRHEGLRLKPYLDTEGKLTIGYGRNLDDVGITSYEADAMLLHDISKAITQASMNFDWFTKVNEARRDVITSMVFNMGINRLLGFKNMLEAIEAGDFEKAAEEMINSKWFKQVGGRAIELSQMMKNGYYSER